MSSNAETRVLSFAAINDFFVDDKNCIKNGENAFNSNNVLSCGFDAEIKVLKGSVQARMRKCQYEVMIFLRSDYTIEKSTCSCPRGEFICHHMAALAFHAHYNLSRTDIPCPWVSRPRQGQAQEEAMALPQDPFNSQATGKDDSADIFKKNLKDIDHNMGLLWLMAPEPDACDENLVVYVEDLLVSEDFLNASSKQEFLQLKLKISEAKVKEVAQKTVGQSENVLWLICRKHRITASNFGAIVKAYAINSFSNSLFKKLTGSYNLDGVKQIQYGRKTEKIAIIAFEKQKNLKVEPTGLWLDTCGYLGASPDGFIGTDGLIEVKCPYTHRNSKLEEVLTKKDIIFLQNGQWALNMDHVYYHQIQGQLYLTNRTYCKLILYSSKSLVIYEIKKSIDWESKLILLKKFYFDHYIPYICKH